MGVAVRRRKTGMYVDMVLGSVTERKSLRLQSAYVVPD